MANFSFSGHQRGLGRATLRALKLSRLALMAEHAVQAFWPAFAVACFIIAAALFGVFGALDGQFHRIAVLGVLAVFLAAVIWGSVRFRMPTRAAATRRLDGPDPAQPLASLSDTLASRNDDDATHSIWNEHLRRAERAAARLRPAAPDLRLARFDRLALRLFAPVLLIGGLIGASGNWTGQLATLFAPLPAASGPAAAAVAERSPLAEAWVIPPAYTGRTTVYLNKLAATGQDILVPEGSELIARVTDLDGAPELVAPGVSDLDGFIDFGGALAEARGRLDTTGRIEIRNGDAVLAGWDLIVLADAAPEIWIPEPPGATLAGALEVHFAASDDYGIDTAWVEIVPMGGVTPGKGLDLPAINFGLPLPISGQALEISDSAIRDLGEHPWAGAWVELALFAEDAAGQQATTGPVTMRLPGRHFSHPLARALVEQRRDLALDFGQAPRVLDVLQAVTRDPQEVFGDNSGAYLGVRTAIRRLASGVAAEAVPEVTPDVAEFLWLAALSLEDGDLSSALERLRSAEEALRRALESGTDEDIRRAMQDLRAAMQDYIQEMTRQALERGLEPGEQGPGGEQQMMSQQDLEEMLDELQRRAESGLRDAARDMLSELSQMLENLQAGRPQPGGGQQSLEALQDMIQRQRDLADRTFDSQRQQRREGQQPGGQSIPGSPGDGEGRDGQEGKGDSRTGDGQSPGGQGGVGDLSAEQEALRRALNDLARQLQGGDSGMSQALEDAARAMEGARDDLDNNNPGEAVEDQMEALDRLNEGAEALAQELRDGQGDTAAQGRGQRDGEARDLETDPFDRPLGAHGAIDGRNTNVPDRSALDRAREVLNELRRRAAEPHRPRIELDYFDRLLDQF